MADDLRERFDAELRASGLTLGAADAAALFEMWREFLLERERFRAWQPEPGDEPWQ